MKIRKPYEGLRSKKFIGIDKIERHHAALAYHCAYIGGTKLVIEGPRDPANAIRTCDSLIPFDSPIFAKD